MALCRYQCTDPNSLVFKIIETLGEYCYWLTFDPALYRRALKILFGAKFDKVWRAIWRRCAGSDGSLQRAELKCGYDMVVIQLASFYMLQYENYAKDYVNDRYAHGLRSLAAV